MGPGSYFGNNINMRSPEQFQAEYNNLMNTYRNIYGQLNNSMMNNPYSNMPSMPQNQNGGEFRYIESYEEVENTPTRLDGVPTLFVLFSKGLMWSKKYEKGQHTVQAYQFGPVNSYNKEPEKETENKSLSEENKKENDINEVLGKILKRIENLENSQQKMEVKKNELESISLFSKGNNESSTSSI